MILAILLCLLIATTPLAYAVYRAYKLAELERIARTREPQASYIVTEKHRDAVGEWWTASLSDDPKIIAPGQTKIEAIEKIMKKVEKLPQPDYEEIQAVYPADWKPRE